MAAASGTTNSDVRQPALRALVEEVPFEFDFFQMVRLLERILPRRAPVGRFTPPSREVARFTANPQMAFPASQIQHLEWTSEGPIQVMVNFMGLYGPMGALPLYYTELIRARHRARDRALSSFLDLFNHRMISLFYQAWVKYRFPVAYERGERDRFSQYLLDLIGIGTPGLQDRQSIPDDSLLFYSGLLSLHPRSALALEQILSDYFDVPVTLEQFVGKWYPLELDAQCKFDRGNTFSEQLGVGAVVGDEVYDPQSGARIRIGPLTLEQYLEFLPNGSAYEPLRALTRFYSGGEIDFEVQLVLRREDVPRCELGALGEAGPQLGWITWMKTAPMGRDPEDTILRF